MSIDLKSLSEQQQKQLFDELRKDQEFLKMRNTLLGVTIVGGICMFAAGWMMFNKMISALDLVTIIAVFIFCTTFLSRRLTLMQKTILERWQKEGRLARQDPANDADDGSPPV